jgi:hypothetical protein
LLAKEAKPSKQAKQEEKKGEVTNMFGSPSSLLFSFFWGERVTIYYGIANSICSLCMYYISSMLILQPTNGLWSRRCAKSLEKYDPTSWNSAKNGLDSYHLFRQPGCKL